MISEIRAYAETVDARSQILTEIAYRVARCACRDEKNGRVAVGTRLLETIRAGYCA